MVADANFARTVVINYEMARSPNLARERKERQGEPEKG